LKQNKRISIWILILIIILFLGYTNLIIRNYNKLVLELSQVNQRLLHQMNGHEKIVTKRFETLISRQFPDRNPQEIAADILLYLDSTGPPINQLTRNDSLWMIQVISNKQAISFYIVESNNYVLLDSCTNIHYIFHKMESKRRLEKYRIMK